jgi:outer membrane protein W
MKTTRTVAAFVLVVAVAMPTSAQTSDPSISIRPFAMGSLEWFTAKKTFDAVFGKSSQLLLGGGLEVATAKGWYLDVAVSRFKKTGERVFVSNGTTFHFDPPISVTATLMPLEATAGYRFHVGSNGRLRPYVGAGVGSYAYKQESPGDDPGEKVDVRHTGFLVAGGAQYRIQRWVSVSADAQYTSISGILGAGGVSQQVNEKDLGGIAARFRILIGK